MKKILLLIDFLGQGGAERQMVYLATELNKAGCNVRLIKFFDNDGAYLSQLQEAGIDVETDRKGSNRWRRILRIIKIVIDWRPDMTIAYKDGTCIAASLARLFVKFRLAVSERNTTQSLSKFEKMKFFIFRKADYIIPNSHSQTEFIMNQFPNLSSRLRTITNMIDMERFYPAKDSPEIKRVIIAARLTEQKNVIGFLEAISLINVSPEEVHFDWFGKIQEEEYYTKIKETVDKLKLGRIITFHAEGSKNIEEEYRKSTHFILPSIYEGFPNVLCEAMASGLVCIASNVCDNPYILPDKQMLFDPKDPQDIADKISYALNLSREQCNNIRLINQQRISDLCSAKVFCNQYLNLIG